MDQDKQRVCQHETLHPADRIIFFGEDECPLCAAEKEKNFLKTNCRELCAESPKLSSKFREFMKG